MPADLAKGGDDGEKGGNSFQPAKKSRRYYVTKRSNVKLNAYLSKDELALD